MSKNNINNLKILTYVKMSYKFVQKVIKKFYGFQS